MKIINMKLQLLFVLLATNVCSSLAVASSNVAVALSFNVPHPGPHPHPFHPDHHDRH